MVTFGEALVNRCKVYNPAKADPCAPGTREPILATLHAWIYSKPTDKTYGRKCQWITGGPGTGKSALVGSLYDAHDALRRRVCTAVFSFDDNPGATVDTLLDALLAQIAVDPLTTDDMLKDLHCNVNNGMKGHDATLRFHTVFTSGFTALARRYAEATTASNGGERLFLSLSDRPLC